MTATLTHRPDDAQRSRIDGMDRLASPAQHIAHATLRFALGSRLRHHLKISVRLASGLALAWGIVSQMYITDGAGVGVRVVVAVGVGVIGLGL